MATLRRSRSQVVALLTAAFAVSLPAIAEAQTGRVSGQILNAADGSSLPGANVTMEGQRLGTTSGDNGRFTIHGVPAGSHTLVVSFIGFATERQPVTVTSGATINMDIKLSSQVLEGGELVVTGMREGQVRALAQKRSAANQIEVLSADAIGKLPDQNVAEALRRVPGLTIQTDRGKGRFVVIRGAEPNLSNVTLNGQSLASTDQSRATALDAVPSELVSSIEVVKSTTPDMDGDAIGGAININTLSAFDRPGRFFFGAVNGLLHDQVVDYRDDGTPFNLSATGGGRFGADEEFGIVLSGHFLRRHYKAAQESPNDWEEFDGYYLPEEYEVELEDTQRDRLGVNANFDWHPADDLSLYVRSFYTSNNEVDDNAEFIYGLAEEDPEPANATSGLYPEPEGGLDLSINDEEEELYAVTLGGEKRFDNLTWKAAGTLTHGTWDRYTEKPEFVGGGTDFATDYVIDGETLRLSPRDPAAWANPALYEWGEVDIEFESNTEDTYTIGSDLRWDTRFAGNPGFVQGGLKARMRTKTIDDLEDGYEGGSDPESLALHGITPPDAPEGPNAMQVLGDTERFMDFFWDNCDKQTRQCNDIYHERDDAESEQEAVENDSDNDENVYAGYVMASANFGKLNVLGGLRIERTETESRRWQLERDLEVVIDEDGEEDEEVVRSQVTGLTFSNDYTNLLPSLHLRYNVDERLVVRGSWTNTLGRPDYEELAGFREFEWIRDLDGDYEGSVEEGNPFLKPFKAMGFDAVAEYYVGAGGLVSAGVFHKIIDDPIYLWERAVEDTTYEGIPFEELEFVQRRNADSGSITGLELAYNQLFTFVPAPFNGFGLASNLSVMTSESKVPGREDDDLPFFGQSDLVYNVTPYFQRAGAKVRLALSYQSEYLDEIGEEQYLDRYNDERTTVDLTATYAIDRYKIIFQGRNLTNQAEEQYQGVSSRRSLYVQTGATYMLGLQTSF